MDIILCVRACVGGGMCRVSVNGCTGVFYRSVICYHTRLAICVNECLLLYFFVCLSAPKSYNQYLWEIPQYTHTHTHIHIHAFFFLLHANNKTTPKFMTILSSHTHTHTSIHTRIFTHFFLLHENNKTTPIHSTHLFTGRSESKLRLF